MIKRSQQKEHCRKPSLEESIGKEIRALREERRLSNKELARGAGISTGFLSRIEHGMASPSIDTLSAIAKSLYVPVSTLFESHEQVGYLEFTRAGHGALLTRKGRNSSELLGTCPYGPVALRPVRITLLDEFDGIGCPLMGMALIYVVSGAITYTYADQDYSLRKGDSILFETSTPHSLSEVTRRPATLLIVCSHLDPTYFQAGYGSKRRKGLGALSSRP